MKYCNIMTVAAIGLLLVSCSTAKNITYFQDLRPGESEQAVTAATEIEIQPKDKLSIIVNCADSRLTSMFNLPIVSQQIDSESTINVSRGLSGYTVDVHGNIDFPILGTLHVQGMTREEIANYIKKELQTNDLVKDPVVTVEFMNLTVSVLGEVNAPGRYTIDKDHYTVLDALGKAGDLTIYGKREKVLVLRNEKGTQRVYGVNLCSANHLYTSPAYYLQQNDVVYVEPNDTRARQSTVNGNNVRSTSFWFSLVSLLTTLGVLIFK